MKTEKTEPRFSQKQSLRQRRVALWLAVSTTFLAGAVLSGVYFFQPGEVSATVSNLNQPEAMPVSLHIQDLQIDSASFGNGETPCKNAIALPAVP